MSNLPYKNPISPLQVLGSSSVSRTDTFGTNFSVLGTGGFMEVYNLSDLNYTIPIGQTGTIEFSGNTIPVQFKKGTGSVFSPDVLTLNSDNISTGRRRLGMLVYVYETKKIYQHTIDDYDNLWTAATSSSGPGGATVVISDFGTTVKNNTVAGQNFINAWTGSTIEGVSGFTSSNATWRILQTGGGSGSTISGDYLPLSGGTVSGGTVFQSGLTANTVSATTYFNLPVTADTFVTGFTLSSNTITLTQNRSDQYSSFTISLSAYTGNSTSISGDYLPLSGGTVSGDTVFQSGLTATTISATTYQNLPNTLYTGDGVISGNRIVGIGNNYVKFSSATDENNFVVSGGSVGVGVSNPKTKFHILKGSPGSMDVSYYESAVIQNSGDTKFGVYTNVPQFSGGGSSFIFGYSNLTDNDGFFPGFEFQHKGSSQPNSNVVRYNFVQRDSSGQVLRASSELLNIFADGAVVLSGTTQNISFPVQPRLGVNVEYPSTILHISGDSNPIRFEGLSSSANSRFLVSNVDGIVSYRTDILTTATTLTAQTIYNSDGSLSGNRVVDLNSKTLNFSGSGSTNNLVLSGGNVGIGVLPTNKLHISATTDPIRIQGIQNAAVSDVLTVDGNGVVHKTNPSSLKNYYFLTNSTENADINSLSQYQSIFNPSNLSVISGTSFSVDSGADYYILGDLFNSGTTTINGTIKVGGVIYNSGIIQGTGIIE